MYSLVKDLAPKSVVWAHKNIYYDEPGLKIEDKKSMFLITMVNEEYFFGCPLTKNNSLKSGTVLHKSVYPIKYDSTINERLYKLCSDDIVGSERFKVSDGAFEHFTRRLYQRIAIGKIDSPEEYNELFVSEYLKNHYPVTGDIVVYPSCDKIFKYYYIYSEDRKQYHGLKLQREGYNNYHIASNYLSAISKDIRFYDYYKNHMIRREDITKVLLKK